MRHPADRQPRSLFRGAELPRLMTMIVMLVVLWMMIQKARDANTWRWLTGDGPTSASAAGDREVEAAPTADLAPLPPAPQPTGATDLDQEEVEGALEEFQAITDRAPLSAIENPAYWRLHTWARNSTTKDLTQRARRDVLFRQLLEAPDEYRGQPIRLRLHLMQLVSWPVPADNKLGVEKVYEAWGWTDDSQSNPYCVAFTDLPTGMPSGANLQEEATFVGYFFKLLGYGAVDEKRRMAPLLIGRLVWHPVPGRAATGAAGGWTLGGWNLGGWTLYALLGGLLGLWLAVRVALPLWRGRKHAAGPASANRQRELAAWLDRGDDGDRMEANAPPVPIPYFDVDPEPAGDGPQHGPRPA